MPRSPWAGEVLDLVRSLPRYLRAERRDRGDFIRAFMRRYEGVDEAELRRMVADRLCEALLQRAHAGGGAADPTASRRRSSDRAHHRDARRARRAARVAVRRGGGRARCTAATACGPAISRRRRLVGEARAAWLSRYADDHGVDLPRSFAYGDSYSDRPCWRRSATRQAVNPDPYLFRHAKRRHWHIHRWGQHTQGPLEALVDSVATEPAR